MPVQLNHTIVHSRDNRESAEFFARIMGLEVGAEWGPFIAVELSNRLEAITRPYGSGGEED